MTTIVFDAEQFGAVLCLVLFMFFFYIGYHEEKRSAGAFLLVGGLLLLGMCVSSYNTIPGIIIGVMLMVSIFVSLIGINKWLIKPHQQAEEEKKTGRRKPR